MQRKKFIKTVAFIAVMLSFLLTACGEKKNGKQAAAKQQTYTCSMHPQIIQEGPGTCPICGMDLVPFDKNNTDPFLTLSESQMALANITTLTVGSGALSDNKILNGRLSINPEQTAFISSRVAGRIEVLYIKETGVRVNKGQPLYKIYSEQLAALQQEYLLAVAQARQFPADDRFQQIEKAARQKLLLYDQTGTQLQQLVTSQKMEPYVTYPAPVSGVVAELMTTEGQYVSEGGTIMRIEGYTTLWVEADVYPGEAANIKVGQAVKVIIPGWEDQQQNMTIRFINPAFQSGSQLMQVRGTISNPNNQWQPGLQVNILLPVKSTGNVLTLPVDAVIRDGKGMHVWIEESKGKFVPRMVRTGMGNADIVEITEGVKEGEKVVITGAYLLYSEYILKKGADPMAGHKHG
jgi:membrane fusion protein, copper/silver efflux system